MRGSPLLPPGSVPYNPAAPAGSFGAARTRSRSASFSTYCPPPIVVPINNSSDPAFPGSTSPSPSGYPGPAFPGSSCSPSPQDFGLSSCENSPAFPGHSPSEFFQARTVVRSPNQELVRQRAAESADMDSQWEMPPSPAARTPCTCRRNPCACAILSKRASRTGPPLSTSGWGRRLRRSLSGGTSAGNSDSEGGAEPRRSRSLLLRPSKTIANGNATSDTEDMGYGSGTGGESGRSTTGRRAQFARLFTRTGTAPPRPSTSNGFHSGSLEGILSPNHAAPCGAANHVSPPAASRGFVARCASVDAAAPGMFGGNNGDSSNAERPGRPSSATSQKYSRSPSPTSSGSHGATTKGIWRITASSVTSPPPADLSPESLSTGPNHPSRGASPVPRVISIDNAVSWLNNTRKGQSQGRRSADGAATDGASPASRAPARRASFGGGSSRTTNASIGSVISANEDDLSRAWDDFTASTAAAATGTIAGDNCGGVSYTRHVEHQAAIARRRQPQSQQKTSGAAQQTAFRPSASCGSLKDLVPDDSSPVEYSGSGYGGGGFGGGYGSDFSKPSKSKGNMNLGATHPPSRRGLSRPTPPPPRPNSPNAAPRPTHSRSPSASGAVGTTPPGQSRGRESTEPIRFRVNTNGRIYRSHTTPACLAPSASASASASSPSSASATSASASSRTRQCVIPNSLSLQDPCEPTDLLNSPTIGRSIPEPGNDTSAPAAVASSSGVSPPNRGERRPTRQVSFNELVRVRRIPRHFFSADMTAAAMDLVSGNDPTSINGVHASSHASPASSATAQGPVGAESPGGRIGGRKGDSASAPAPAPARSSAHAAASAAQTQPRSAAPTSSPAPAPAPALVPTPPPWSSAGGAGGARRVSRSGSWSSTGGSAAARNALPSEASDGSGCDGSSGGYRAVNSNNNNGASGNGASPTAASAAAGRVSGSGSAVRGSGGTDGSVREGNGGAIAGTGLSPGGNGGYAGGSSGTGGSVIGGGGRNVPVFGETGGRGAAGLGAPVRHARSRSFVERSGNDVARMAALAAAAGAVAGGGNGRGAVGGMVARCSSVSLSDRPTADVSNRSSGSSSSGSIPLRRNSDRPERANRTSSSSTFSSSSSSAGSGIGTVGTGGDGGSGSTVRNSSGGSGGSGGNRVPGPSVTSPPAPRFAPHPPSAATRSPASSARAAAAAAAAGRGPPSHTLSADRLPLQRDLSGTGTCPGGVPQGPQGPYGSQGHEGHEGHEGSQGSQGTVQHPPQSPHQKLSSQGLSLRSPRHARHHSMGSAAALGTHPSPRATAHATALAAAAAAAAAPPLATAATAGLASKTAGDSVPRPFATGPRMPPSVLVGISQSLRSLSVQSVQSPSTPRSPGPHSPPPHSPRTSPRSSAPAPLSPRSSAPLSPRSSAPAPLSPRASAPLSPRSFAAAPLSPRSTAPAPLSPRSSAPLSPRSFAPPLSPRSFAPLSPRASVPLSPRASAPLYPRSSAPLSPRSSAPLSPRFPGTRSPIPRSNTSSNTTTRTPYPPAAAGFKAPAAPDQSRAKNAPPPRRHVRSASVAEVTCT
ncbi:unnamed protein product [Closterium sp. NIES-54]